jgi:hypothetical protein
VIVFEEESNFFFFFFLLRFAFLFFLSCDQLTFLFPLFCTVFACARACACVAETLIPDSGTAIRSSFFLPFLPSQIDTHLPHTAAAPHGNASR